MRPLKGKRKVAENQREDNRRKTRFAVAGFEDGGRSSGTKGGAGERGWVE